MLTRAYCTHACFLPPAVQSLKAESGDEVTFLHESHKLHCPTFTRTRWGSVKLRQSPNPNCICQRRTRRVFHNPACHRIAFQRLLWEGNQRKMLGCTRMVRTRCWWQECPSQPGHISLCVMAMPSHLQWIFPGHQLKLLIASKGHFSCIKQTFTLLWTNQPRPQTHWKLLREQCHPFAPQAQCSPEPKQEWGEAKKQSWRFSISSCKSLRSCRCNQSYFFLHVSPVCLAKNKWAGLIKPKLY